MTPLPPPVDEVVGPEWLSASKLGLATECPLSLALANRALGIEALPPHPRATYGSLLHRAYEAASRGEVPPGDGFPAAMYGLLERAVGDLPAHVPGPLAVYGFEEWTERTSDVVDHARELAASFDASVPRTAVVSSGSEAKRPGPMPRFVTETNRLWPEEWLESKVLRVSGRADLLERRGDHVVVTDLKTGRGASGPKGVTPGVALQLRAYGLIVLEHLPSATVELVVKAGTSVPVSFTETDQAETRAALKTLADRLPASEVLSAEALAVPGPACRYCAYRHRCRAYLDAAPLWWATGADHPLPVDVWGRVETVAHNRTSTSVTVKDPTGRLVPVARLRSAADVVEGSLVYAFGLRGRAPRTAEGLMLAPPRYADLNPDHDEWAWSLALFRGAHAAPAVLPGTDG